jgi:hypothetical protein
MSALQPGTRSASPRSDADRAAAVALLDAITREVRETREGAVGREQRIETLKALAEAYAYVTQGRKLS